MEIYCNAVNNLFDSLNAIDIKSHGFLVFSQIFIRLHSLISVYPAFKGS